MVPILTCETSSKSTSPTSRWPDFLAGSGTNDTTYMYMYVHVQLSIHGDKPVVPRQTMCGTYTVSRARVAGIVQM